MKYFEFNKHAYYGLIGSENKEQAKSYFYEVVCDEEDDDGEPDEISREVAKEKHVEACKESIDWQPGDLGFDELEQMAENNGNNWLVLIDGGLLS